MRQLVTNRVISELIPIENADFIELAKVDGWQCIVKKGDFKVGDPGLYFEIDSMIPASDKRFEFLGKGQVRTHYRIKTMRMRKVLSQGLLMPLSILTDDELDRSRKQFQGEVVETWTDIFRVEKYEPPLPIDGVQKGNFPTHLIPKTDQERIQNMPKALEGQTSADFEITEKLDGTSCTFYYFNDPTLDTEGDVPAEMTATMGACSRNWEMKLDDDNVYAQIFKASDLEAKFNKLKRNIAIQGEIIGGRIQGNKYQRGEQEFYVFDIYDITTRRYLGAVERKQLVETFGLKHVPRPLTSDLVQDVPRGQEFMPLNLDLVLAMAEGKSMLFDTQREGLVFKSLDGKINFKVISNKFLLKNND